MCIVIYNLGLRREASTAFAGFMHSLLPAYALLLSGQVVAAMAAMVSSGGADKWKFELQEEVKVVKEEQEQMDVKDEKDEEKERKKKRRQERRS